MVSKRRLAVADRKRADAASRAKKAASDYVALSLMSILAQNPEFKALEAELKKLNADIHNCRLNITKKSRGLVIRRKAIADMEEALKKCQHNEKLFVGKKADVQNRINGLQAKIQAQVMKNLKGHLEPIEATA